MTTFYVSSCTPIAQGAAAVGAYTTSSVDRRSAGEIIDDRFLHIALESIIKEDPLLENLHVKFMVYNGTALVVGEAPNPEIKTYLTKQIEENTTKMNQLINEVAVMPSIGYFARAKDNIISLQIETLFHNQEVFHPVHVKVMTERQIVYLMGAVTKREAEHATNQAAKAKNVVKVVKLFDYLKSRPADEIEKESKKRAEAERKAALEAKKAELEAAQKELQKQLDELYAN